MEKLRVCFASDYSEIFLRCLWNEWSLCWFCFEFSLSCTYNCWSIAECCRLPQCIWSLILCIFCDVLLTVVHVLMCVWCVGCWLPCIFTSVEFDILCILAFSQKMEHSSSRAPWCQKRIWALTVLGSVLVEDRHLCWAHQPVGTCFGTCPLVQKYVFFYRLSGIPNRPLFWFWAKSWSGISS